MSPFGNAEEDKKTEEAFENPQVGDRFTEMYSFWMYVIGRFGDKIITIEGNSPCTFPEEGKIIFSTVEEFRKRFSYETIKGYYVRLVDRGNNVEGWIEAGVGYENL